MLDNQRGNTLITVMITSLVVITLGMAVLSASIGGAKRTEVRETDIDITYDGLRLVDEMTADLSAKLSLDSFKIQNISAAGLTAKLSTYFTSRQSQLSAGDSISCVNVVDVTSDTPKYLISGVENQCLGDTISGLQTFGIDPARQLTRVLEFVVAVETPENQEGTVSRTIRKRVILSPLPGFLKYAAGAEEETILNGSPNIAGNVFGKKVTIDKNAHYQLTDGNDKEIETPYSSIFGDIYIDSSKAKYIEVMDYLTADKFYHNRLPQLKNDSQFIEVEFEKTINEQINVIQQEQGFTQTSTLEELPDELVRSIKNAYSFTPASFPGSPALESLDGLLDEDLVSQVDSLSYKLIDRSTDSNIQVPGDLVISSVSSNLNFPGKIIADGDIYIIGNQNIALNDVIATGDIHLINLNGAMTVKGDIISGGSINIQGNSNFLFKKDTLTNETGYMLAGTSLNIESLDSASTIIGNIIAGGQLFIQGNSNEGDLPEDDEVIFDSVIYSGGEAFISNLNISGSEENTKQLILLAGGKLTMTRMNEYKNFVQSEEGDDFNGIVRDTSIKPLKAFFYTNEMAELYGVGSLFHIDGGVFAHHTLKINAIRGEISNIREADLYSTKIDQDLHYSRFNINYNRDILLQKIDALPKTESLSLFSDEVSVQ
ncbi:hypothetical protein D3H55_03840 [Bacillus salacetis]|uniref:Uncharacterized protein n=1 Tax=Bacillus salacetis TaxID=2315464 RepID=A0A3A1R542_9BACI|nr:hypothetical protein [Bacillus salacetis]RIW37709.1 hypothetical protein D3H55_03840 [Bacillus salacetis]